MNRRDAVIAACGYRGLRERADEMLTANGKRPMSDAEWEMALLVRAPDREDATSISRRRDLIVRLVSTDKCTDAEVDYFLTEWCEPARQALSEHERFILKEVRAMRA